MGIAGSRVRQSRIDWVEQKPEACGDRQRREDGWPRGADTSVSTPSDEFDDAHLVIGKVLKKTGLGFRLVVQKDLQDFASSFIVQFLSIP